jgi:hypothetical protein
MISKLGLPLTAHPTYTVIYTEPMEPVNEGWFPEPVIGRLCFIDFLWVNYGSISVCLHND